MLGFHHPSPLPGFGSPSGITMTMLSLVVLIPIGALILRGAAIGPAELWALVASERVAAALRLSFGTALAASRLQPRLRAGARLGADPLPLPAAAG